MLAPTVAADFATGCRNAAQPTPVAVPMAHPYPQSRRELLRPINDRRPFAGLVGRAC